MVPFILTAPRGASLIDMKKGIELWNVSLQFNTFYYQTDLHSKK